MWSLDSQLSRLCIDIGLLGRSKYDFNTMEMNHHFLCGVVEDDWSHHENAGGGSTPEIFVQPVDKPCSAHSCAEAVQVSTEHL